jgi:hypothetical protein
MISLKGLRHYSSQRSLFVNHKSLHQDQALLVILEEITKAHLSGSPINVSQLMVCDDDLSPSVTDQKINTLANEGWIELQHPYGTSRQYYLVPTRQAYEYYESTSRQRFVNVCV